METKTAEEYEASFSLLIQILQNVEIESITHAKARKVKETLLALPAHHTKGIYAGKTIKQILKMEIDKTMAITTVNTNCIQCYISLFRWAVNTGFCSTNPFAGLKVRGSKKKAVDGKEPFTSTDLNTIISHPDFKTYDDSYSWKFWTVLLAIYTGARVTEIAQLRPCDVYPDDNGVWVMNITEEAGSVKNITSNRIIPIHPDLTDMVENGFDLILYFHECEQRKQDKLFPELYTTANAKKGGKVGDKVSKWFNNTYLKKIGLKPTERKLSFHSFRHSFIDYFKKLEVPETKVKQLTGHSHSSTTFGTYGSEYNSKDLYDLICKLEFDISSLRKSVKWSKVEGYF